MTRAVDRATRSPAVSVLKVLLGDQEIGTITNLPGDRSLFIFNEEYAEDPQRPVLSLSFKTVDGGVDTPPRPTRRRVAPFFSNLLPEGHLRDYIASLGSVNPQREFFLLWLLGQDLPGAVIVRPPPPDGEELPSPSAEGLTPDRHKDHLMRFSLAGVQLKFSAVMEADGGLTIPARGVGGSWIVKLPSVRFPAVAEMEFAMMELARSVGIEVPEVHLVSADDLANLPENVATLGNSLAVRRFDRGEGNCRIHIEDFAQVFGVFPEQKYEEASYESIARVLWAEAGLEGVVELTRRLAFSALIGNADMHLKNWSMIYEDGRSAGLAPGYDFVATVAYMNDAHMALSLGGTKDMHAVDLELFARFAGKAGLPETAVLEAARGTAERLRTEWGRNPGVRALPRDQRSRVEAHMRLVPLGMS